MEDEWLPKTDRLNKTKALWIQTDTPGYMTQAYKVINDTEMNKKVIKHSFHSRNCKAHSVFILFKQA